MEIIVTYHNKTRLCVKPKELAVEGVRMNFSKSASDLTVDIKLNKAHLILNVELTSPICQTNLFLRFPHSMAQEHASKSSIYDCLMSSYQIIIKLSHRTLTSTHKERL